MKPIRNIQIAAASALMGLFLCGCNEQVHTTGLPPAATNEPTAQSTTQTTTTITAPAPINNPPDTSSATTSSTAAASLPLPVSALPSSTNDLPTAAPLPVTQQP